MMMMKIFIIAKRQPIQVIKRVSFQSYWIFFYLLKDNAFSESPENDQSLVAQNHQYDYQLSCFIRTRETLAEEKMGAWWILRRFSVSTSMSWMRSSYQSNRTLGTKRKRLLKFKHQGKGEQRRNLSQDPGLGLSGVRLSGRWWTGQRGREKGWLYAGAAGNPLTPPRAARGETTFPGTEGCLLLHSRVVNAMFWGEVLPAKFGYLLSLAISR